MSLSIQTELLTKPSLEALEALSVLIPQLSSSWKGLDLEELEKIINQPCVFIFLARDESKTICGTLSLVLFDIPTGTRAWIEDVVVDLSSRGKGVGKSLLKEALSFAHSKNVKTVDLTSRPSRESANKLYQNLGFELRDTNVYRYK